MKELLVLRIQLADNLSGTFVELALERWGHASKEVLKKLSFSGEDFGLRDKLARDESTEKEPFSFPAVLSSKIKTEIGKRYDVGKQPAELWLKFDHPSGYLNLVPWEHNLQPRLKVPILRLPKSYFSPGVLSGGRFDIAIFASAPRAKGQFSVVSHVQQLVQNAITNLPQPVFHVFVEAKYHADMLRISESIENFRVYDPNRSSRFPEARQKSSISTPTNVENPWLRWMLDELAAVTVDSICFIGHGYFANDRGAIALAQSPIVNRDSNWARFVGASELSIFMSQLGAWSVLFSSIENNFSLIGLKSVGFELADMRPGPIVVHDMETDRQFDELAQAMKYISMTNDSSKLLGHANIIYQSPYAITDGVEFTKSTATEISLQADRIRNAIKSRDSKGIDPIWKTKASRYLQKRSVQQAASSPQSLSGSESTISEIQRIIGDYKRDELMGNN